MMSNASEASSDDISTTSLEHLLVQASESLGEIIERVRPSDQRAVRAGAGWARRHRLMVMMEAVEHSIAGLATNVVTAPWFIVELKATVDVVKRWSKRPGWDGVVRSLVDPTHFRHTILKLHMAEHLEKDGYSVELVRKAGVPHPDLTFDVPDTDRRVYVECKQPLVLGGEPMVLARQEAEKIVRKAFKVSRDQLAAAPGILVLGSYNQPQDNIATLESTVRKTLSVRLSRPHLMAAALANLSVMVTQTEGRMQFSRHMSINYVLNPGYSDDVELITKPGHERSDFVEGPFTDIDTDLLLSD